MKNIAIDLTHYGKLSWFGRVANNIIDRLIQDTNYNVFLFIKQWDSSIVYPKEQKNVHIIISNKKNYFLYRLFYQATLIRKYNINVYYSIDQIMPLFKNKGCRYINTIHDIEHWKYCHWFKAIKEILISKKVSLLSFLLYFLSMERFFAKKADITITPSQYTKDQMVKYMGIKEQKIKAVHRGMDDKKMEIINYQHEDYILFPLCIHFFNPEFIIELAQKILQQHITKKIIIRKLGTPNGLYNKTSPNKNIIIDNRRLSDEEKERLFGEAFCSIYISSWDGFWIVPLENMVLWTPVIYNSIASLPEISGDWWIAIKKLEIDSFIITLKRLENDKSYYKNCVERWRERINRYKRATTCKKIEDIFNKI